MSLQGCMRETINVLGGNNYRIPHFGKEHLRRNGNFPNQLECDRQVWVTALLHLQQV